MSLNLNSILIVELVKEVSDGGVKVMQVNIILGIDVVQTSVVEVHGSRDASSIGTSICCATSQRSIKRMGLSSILIEL